MIVVVGCADIIPFDLYPNFLYVRYALACRDLPLKSSSKVIDKLMKRIGHFNYWPLRIGSQYGK